AVVVDAVEVGLGHVADVGEVRARLLRDDRAELDRGARGLLAVAEPALRGVRRCLLRGGVVAAAATAAAAVVAAVATRNETDGQRRDTQCREHAGSPPQRCPSHLILLLGMTRGRTPQSPSSVR